jgi:DNA-binding MarR family transcriptional regulator
MICLRMIVDVTRIIESAGLTNRIIADFRGTMIALKCAASERLLRLGVSMAQLNILYTLHRTGDMTMSGLADVLNVSLSNATGLIDRMEERGYIERTRVPEDRRVVMVRMTPAGTQLLDEHDAMTDELLRTVLDRLRPDQLTGVAEATSALRTAIEATTALMPDRHHASTPAPRSASTMRGTEPPSGGPGPDHHLAHSTRRD